MITDYYSRGALKGSALSKQRVSAKPTLPNLVRMTRKSVYDQFQACKFVLIVDISKNCTDIHTARNEAELEIGI